MTSLMRFKVRGLSQALGITYRELVTHSGLIFFVISAYIPAVRSFLCTLLASTLLLSTSSFIASLLISR